MEITKLGIMGPSGRMGKSLITVSKEFKNLQVVSRLDYYWQDKMYTRLYNTPRDVIDAWDVLNAQVIFQSTVNPWYLKIWGKNLMDDEYLTRCVVDPLKRKLYLYSSEGDEKTVDCETMDQFMSVLRFVRETASDEVLSYVNPL